MSLTAGLHRAASTFSNLAHLAAEASRSRPSLALNSSNEKTAPRWILTQALSLSRIKSRFHMCELKTEINLGGLPVEVVDPNRSAVLAHRSQCFMHQVNQHLQAFIMTRKGKTKTVPSRLTRTKK